MLILAEKEAIRKRILKLEEQLLAQPGAVYGDQPSCPLKHSFGKDIYVREIFMPKGYIVISKIHKFEHPYFVLQGDVSVLTDEGVIRIKAPFQGMTKPGTKRVLYMHEDTVWITVHATKSQDVKEIEEEIIAKTFDEVPELTGREIQMLEEVQ